MWLYHDPGYSKCLSHTCFCVLQLCVRTRHVFGITTCQCFSSLLCDNNRTQWLRVHVRLCAPAEEVSSDCQKWHVMTGFARHTIMMVLTPPASTFVCLCVCVCVCVWEREGEMESHDNRVHLTFTSILYDRAAHLCRQMGLVWVEQSSRRHGNDVWHRCYYTSLQTGNLV